MKTTIITLLIIIGTSLLQISIAQENYDSSIVINDYQPDEVLKYESDTLKIDINGDLINDIKFHIHDALSGGIISFIESINPKCSFSFINYYSNDSLLNDLIIWHSGKLDFLGEQTYSYIEKIGVKISLNDSAYYGWVKVYITYTNKKKNVTIDKYAFCTIPNYPLLWGQTEIVTGTNEFKEDTGIKVYTTDSGSQLVVQSGDVIKSIRVIDLLGATVVVKDNIRDKQATLSTKGLVHGTYIVKVTNSILKEYTSKIVF